MSSLRLLLITLIAFCAQSAFSFGILDPHGIADAIHAVHQTATSAVVHHHHSVVTNAVHHHVFAHPHHANGLDLLGLYKQSLQDFPLQTKMATGATLAVAGDAIAQSQDQSQVSYDQRRAASFAVFDMAYRALQHLAFPIIVASCHGQYLGGIVEALHLDPSWAEAMEETLASQLGIVPFLYYPAFFALTGAVQGLDRDAAFNRAKDMFIPLMKRNLLFWIPVQFIQFGFIEESMQIPFLSVCGLGWTFILSIAAGSTKGYSSQEEAPALPDPVAEMTAATFNADSVSEEVLTDTVTQAIANEMMAEQTESSYSADQQLAMNQN